MSIGFCTDLDVDLTLSCEDSEPCFMDGCSSEAVMEADLTVPCGCKHQACLSHYEVEKARWPVPVELFCYFCKDPYQPGLYLGWHKL